MASEDSPGTGALESLPADEVRELLAAQSAGVLCTLSERLGGWPFASLASYAPDARGEPIFLFSRLAQHTRNIDADPRATLFLYEGSAGRDDPQTGRRAALAGRVVHVTSEEEADAKARYLRRHPQAQPYFDLDFRLYRLAVEHVHYVGGFAQAAWVPAGEVFRGR